MMEDQIVWEDQTDGESNWWRSKLMRGPTQLRVKLMGGPKVMEDKSGLISGEIVHPLNSLNVTYVY